MHGYSASLLQRIRRHLSAGGVIAYPTESCYGLGCDPFNYTAINQIIRIKGRSKTKGLIVIAGNIQQLNPIIQPLTPADKTAIANYWPGFYSLILAVSRKVPPNLIGHNPKIAVRVSKHAQVRQLCRALKMALVSTSANKSGCKPCKTYRECVRRFGKQVLVLPGISNFARKPSTIIDWENKRVLRS